LRVRQFFVIKTFNSNHLFTYLCHKPLPQKMNKDLAIFQQYFPESTVQFCYDLWKEYQFKFKVTRPRQSKLGDYCYRRDRGHQITVNANLNPYSFLVTYIHEVAHLQTFKQYGNKPEPHGKEWKRYFRETFQPLLKSDFLPIELIIPLTEYLKNPAATTQGAKPLMNALRLFDTNIDLDSIVLTSIEAGENFELNGRIFTKGELRRTRFLCTDRQNGKRYVIASNALVKRFV
jgi:SprT protein